jgi:hypothetical protein
MGGEYSTSMREPKYILSPLAVVLIFLILFVLYGNYKLSSRQPSRWV